MEIEENKEKLLINLLLDPTTQPKRQAVLSAALAKPGNEIAVPALLQILASSDLDLSWAAASALKKIDSIQAIEPLIQMLQKGEEATNSIAIIDVLGILGHLDQEKVMQALLNISFDAQRSPTLRGEAIEALTKVHYGPNNELAGLVFPLLQDESVEVRFWSVFALSHFGDKEVIPHLQKLVENDDEILTGWWSVSKEAQNALEIIRQRTDLGYTEN